MSFINGIRGACYPWWSLVICLLVGAALMLAGWLYLCRLAMRGYFPEGKEVKTVKRLMTLLSLIAFVVAVVLIMATPVAASDGTNPLVDWIVAGIVLLVPAIVGWVFARLSEPLRRLKKIWAENPIVGIVASAIVMAVEMVWSEYDGEYQFDRACELLANWLAGRGIEISPAQIKEIVQDAYETIKELFGNQWDSLKMNLAGK